ncbi:hypothetical protein NLY43_21800 [Mesorhizobium sp. C416B]|nr:MULTISPECIES: hypothetical protein [unclassified Mesorhizobium]ESX47238.1 hypothetical protein X762_18995 [Mesorhizobium sp. LSHC426A00]ESX56684.1 hypothetical protein X761_10050 [Mesorhizobium sp. LSHC424B00]ESX71513.1 hypothetical protein X758_15740 [Mesorhizobium sp. LSHC416B00]WJI61242.1 hypothetical protein NLY43_21800 [Mesorhizobium sp. C416B]
MMKESRQAWSAHQQSALRKNWEQAAGPVNGSIMAEQFEPATEITPGSLQ